MSPSDLSNVPLLSFCLPLKGGRQTDRWLSRFVQPVLDRLRQIGQKVILPLIDLSRLGGQSIGVSVENSVQGGIEKTRLFRQSRKGEIRARIAHFDPHRWVGKTPDQRSYRPPFSPVNRPFCRLLGRFSNGPKPYL
jgi:hypothetical protein